MSIQDGEGAVPRSSVVSVLKSVLPEAGVSIVATDIEGKKVIFLVKDGIPEVIVLAARIPRKMLHRLANKYGVRIEFFYHPEMCCPGTLTHQ